MKYIFTLNDIQTLTIELASETDFKNGYRASYVFPEEVNEVMETVGNELMEGIWEAHVDMPTVREKLLAAGFEENLENKV